MGRKCDTHCDGHYMPLPKFHGGGQGKFSRGKFLHGTKHMYTLGDGRYVVAGRLPCDRLAAEATDK